MVCLITGSSRGLGKAVAIAFGSRGHRVVIHCKKNKSDAEDVASKMKESMVVEADVKNIHEVKPLVNEVVNRYGRIDVLVNNAGITKESLLIKTSEQDFDEVVNVNLKGPFNFIRIVGRHMMKQKSGSIINISSYAGVKGKEGLASYSASKAGLIGLTKTASREMAPFNVSVNAVLPGYMLTDMGAASSGKAREAALENSLIKEFSSPELVAEFIFNLTEMKEITGQVFNLDSRIV